MYLIELLFRVNDQVMVRGHGHPGTVIGIFISQFGVRYLINYTCQGSEYNVPYYGIDLEHYEVREG